MKKLSKKISLQFLILVLTVLIAMAIFLAFTFVRAATDEYTDYLETKKQSVFKWFVDKRRDLKSYADTYSVENIVSGELDVLLLRDEGEARVILNRPGLSQDFIDEIESSGNGFKFDRGQLIYYSAFESAGTTLIAGIVFDNSEIESLSNYLGQDAIAFLIIEDYFVIPREFSDSGMYVRTVLDEERWSKQTPFTVNEVKSAFDFLGMGNRFLVDKVSIGGAQIYVLQSEGMLVLLRNRLLPVFVFVLLGVFGFSFILSFSLNSYISRALSELLKGFESIKKGSFTSVKLKSNDELGEIASELNNTIFFIEKTLDRLKNSNELLRKVSKEAQQASKMKSEFLANMSHEMRTPMNAILGFTELLMNDEDSLERLKYLKTIYRSGEHLLSLINDVLDLSKIEAARFELIVLPYNPAKLVKELVETYLPMAYSKGIHLACSVADNVPEYVDGDEFRVRQVLTNLISNGLKFTKNGYVTLLLSYESGTVTYVVQDTGSGVSKDQLEKIFEPFTQADGTMSRKYGGTGLGLTITRKIVELMGGNMKFESKINEGSKVTVRLPATISREIPREKARVESTNTGKVILATEDDDFAMLIGSMLRKNSIPFETVKNVKATARAVRELNAKLVLLDISQYDRDWIFDVLERIENTVVIGLNRIPGEESEPNIWLKEVLSEPIREEDLIRKIGEYTDLAPSSSKNQKILLVEDNEANQLLIKKILENAGYTVQLASNGLEAIELAKKETHALILMDMQMPILDGYEATRTLRQDGIKVPIVALTAHTMQGDEEKTLEVGCDGFLGKPVKQVDLLDTVRYYTDVYGKTGLKRETLPKGDEDENLSKERVAVFAREMGLSLEEAAAMFADYGKHVEKSIQSMRDMLKRGELETLSREGHSLKGSGRMYAVERISELGLKIETAAKNNKSSEIPEMISQLERLHRRLW